MSLDGGSIGLATGDGMFRLELLPAAHGDSIWIEYGEPKKPHRIVIDGGPAATYEAGLHKRLLLLPSKDRRIDLLVVTHIDSDHIDGSIILLREAEQLGVHFGEIWFNAWAQLQKDEVEGFKPLQGEFLGALLDFPRYRECWNPRTKGLAIMVPDEGALPSWIFPAVPASRSSRRACGRSIGSGPAGCPLCASSARATARRHCADWSHGATTGHRRLPRSSGRAVSATTVPWRTAPALLSCSNTKGCRACWRATRTPEFWPRR